ncbi:MAG TPA: hypothetical protein VHG51_13560 [Longimicrobiaceae bacterium]|nr:hypothetical protein [Longimicrobiaceae bacterium]
MHRLVLGLVLAAGAGCAPGMMEDVWGDVVHPDRGGVYDRGGYRDDVRGEVRGVDTRNRRIQVRESGGRSVTAYYDGRTRVEYRGRDYRVSSLERGDRVSMRVRRDGGRYYADRVYVTESARDRGGWSRDDRDRRERDRSDAWRDSGRLYGTVQSVNRGQSSFQVRGQSGERVVVYLPRNAGRSTEDRFRRLRRGDRVQVQVRPLDRDRAELRRFL